MVDELVDLPRGSETGIIFGLQHFSVDDGPGIRTAVFLKGCNLHCPWCHNPESIEGMPELLYRSGRCVSCGYCGNICPNGVHRVKFGKHVVSANGCDVCGECTDVCRNRALEIVGRRISSREIVEQAKRDLRYYNISGGGLTITGGEPMYQCEFALDIAELAQQEGIDVVLETNGIAPFEDYQKLLPSVNLFLIDYKLTDPRQHRRLTGVSNTLVLENIRKLYAVGAKIVLRCPIIPSVNDNDEHFAAIAALTQEHSGILGFELMPYHKLGVTKAGALGRTPCEFEQLDETAETVWEQRIIEHGGRKWSDI